jgi:radical SAM protein (TIGR04043 family)
VSLIDLQATSSRLLIGDLQSLGLRLADVNAGAPSRRGGAGPSDHKAVIVDGRTIMVPVHTGGAAQSPFVARAPGPDGRSVLERDGMPVAHVAFPPQPRFYAMKTFDGIPYWKIATLHGRDVLATTVLQECIRYTNERTRCQFCAIGESLAGGRTVAHKTPHELAEVARAAMLLDGISHVVLTTGTPNGTDRGARVLCDSAAAIYRATGLPIQAQCEPRAASRRWACISRPSSPRFARVRCRARRKFPCRITSRRSKPPLRFSGAAKSARISSPGSAIRRNRCSR